MYFPTTLAAITALVDARNSGDIDTALACYEPDATIVAQPGLTLSGLDGDTNRSRGLLRFEARPHR